MVFNYDASDPLAIVTAPPPNETPQEKAAREEREAEAHRISDQIDEEIRADRAALREQEQMVKILLLGQSESGKSTTLKNFRMRFAREKWVQERASWRTVIQLNFVRSVNKILEALQREIDEEDEEYVFPLSDKHHRLRLRLRPLRGIESDLKRLLGAKFDETYESPRETSPKVSPRTSSEFYVRSWDWRSFLQASRNGDSLHRSMRQDLTSHDITEVIAGCKDDIKGLWGDSAIQELIKVRRVRLEDSASFFLDASERLAARNYEPLDDDIVRARLRTLDIQEHELSVDDDGDMQTWKIYDVGGSRTQRNAWLPYFDQVNAVIFLAPISCFDERLQEDPRVNRLEDSFILWKAICSSKLLSRTTLIIFLNKIDILEKKIQSGIMVNRYLPSYANRPNETTSVVKYLRQKFKDTVKHNSPEPRMCHIYQTSVINTKTTAQTLLSVRDGILREQLKRANLV
ncbi:guanine nucleotide binding protein, alpha subunit [Melanogaster broomeanus]|nr:guanine nucleotide binding protein, alpha subunit [Melanogaster broomeanus]